MAALSFEDARASVLARISGAITRPGVEEVAIEKACGRVLAESLLADRDLPPVSRSVRDGFAVRAADLPGQLWIAGEVRAGEAYQGELQPGEAIEIMTGAPVPRGADAIVMLEHVEVTGDRLRADQAVSRGLNIELRGAQALQGEELLKPGERLNFAAVAALAATGRRTVFVYRRPQVAILATGDELVEIEQRPLDYQLRNSNSYSVAAQVSRAGGCPQILPIARDLYAACRELIEHGLRYDLLLLSGGVSAGKYDLVETVLADLGAEFFFDRVRIQPGQPLVFGTAQGRFFFGLPGNPASTMVTFEVFARAAVELLSGETEPQLPLLWSRLAVDFRQKTGLTRFLPAKLALDGSKVAPAGWRGSGDIPAMARSNAWLVTEPEREHWAAGDWIRVLLS